ncbi:hypothetical protein ACEPAH_5342 [Sanghuangporus vaninii]
MAKSPESFMFTVGKLDAGMAILLGERAHLIEFPSILLPPGATAGSIVNIAVHRNLAEEKKRDQEFWDLQKEIYETFGVDTPQPPKLEVRNITQTSVTLEWPELHLATATLRSLDIYRNGIRLAAIPQPRHNTSTKLTGLELNTDYTFQLILRTSAGTYPSNMVRVRTHTMQDTSGISVCFGTVQDNLLLENAKQALREMRARWSDKIQIDTTHFVCTTPAGEGSGANAGPSVEYQRALQVSIPIVQPQWILACHSERKMVPISQFYLGTTPSSPLSSAPFTRPQSMSQVSLQRSNRDAATSPTSGAGNRASMPPPRRSSTQQSEPSASSFVNQGPPTKSKPNGVTPVAEADENDAEEEHVRESVDSPSGRRSIRSPTSAAERHARSGTMDRNFRFPPSSPTKETAPPVPPLPNSASQSQSRAESKVTVSPSDNDSGYAEGEEEGKSAEENSGEEHAKAKGKGKEREETPSSPPSSAVPMEVPPPDPIEKEKDRNVHVDEADDDIGATVEVPL